MYLMFLCKFSVLVIVILLFVKQGDLCTSPNLSRKLFRLLFFIIKLSVYLPFIVINSVRAVDAERQDFMERLCDSKAGNKHHLTKDYLKYLKMQVMKMCSERQLYQVDLLTPAADRITEQEYFAERRGQEKLNKRNAKISAAGLTPRTTKFETRKETLRKQISEIAETAKSFSEF